MEIDLLPAVSVEREVDALVIPVRPGPQLDPTGTEVDARLDGALSAALRDADFSGKVGKTMVIPTLGLLPVRRVVVTGIGDGASTANDLRRAWAIAARAARDAGARSVVSAAPPTGDLGEERAYRAAVEGVRLGLYEFLEYRTLERPEKRVEALEDWFARHRAQYPDLRWWEFAAASGSTLAIFALVSQAAGQGPSPDPPQRLVGCYFPWICGLHILLDYLIDQEEDRREGDLNFVSFYAGQAEAEARMAWMLERALESIAGLRDRHLHLTVVEGLLGLYL